MDYVLCGQREGRRRRRGVFAKVFRWTCPACHTVNESRVPVEIRVKQGRCGHCHRGFWLTTSAELEAAGQERLFPAEPYGREIRAATREGMGDHAAPALAAGRETPADLPPAVRAAAAEIVAEAERCSAPEQKQHEG